MYKIMIADDETLICRGLETLIDWASLDCELVFSAENGQQVVDNLGRYQPDIIISDIKMPLLDGLGVAQYVYNHHFPAKVILLTAFADFSYAKQAIAYGVSDYVTKTGAMDSLIKAVQKCKQQIAYDQQLSASEGSQVIVFLKEVLQGALEDTTEIAQRERQLQLLDAPHRILLFDLAQAVPLGSEESARFAANLRQMAVRELADHTYYIIPLSKAQLCIVLYAFAQESALHFCQYLTEAITALTHYRLRVGISEEGHTAQAMKTALGEAQSALEQYFFNQKPIQQYTKPALPLMRYNSTDIFTYLHEAVRAGKQEAAAQCMNNLFCLQTSGNATVKNIKSDAEYVVNICRRSLECVEADMELVISKGQEAALEAADTLAQYHTLLPAIVDASCEVISKMLQEGSSVVTDAQKYIELHYCEPITLSHIAAAISVNPSYLSRAFKQKVGVSIVDTINRKRVERAKVLLADKRMKIYEITESIGFEDASYFSSIFRKYTGMSPTTYQEKAERHPQAPLVDVVKK